MRFINIGKDDNELILSDGQNSATFDFLEMYILDGKEYAVLLEEGDDMITIMRFCESNQGEPESFYTIDEDEIFDKILDLYKADCDD